LQRFADGQRQSLGERCSFDRHFHGCTPESIELEREEELDSRLMRAWPAQWPEQKFVDLDSDGDASDWIEQGLGNPISETLFGLPLDP